MQKKRLTDDAEHKEQEKIRIRWESNAKKTDGINVFDSHLSEENFIIGDILGSGTFGSVFEATSKKSGKAFALKVITNRCSVYAEKFIAERELLIQRKMTHKNIVPIRGILHRDLKPHNLLYNYDGLVKISDFGIATDERDGTYCGTPRYMAPEIICRQKQTAAVDCYSLGVILHRCSTGKTPFESPDGHVLDEVVSKCKYVPPVSINLSVREVITKLIKRSPNTDGVPMSQLVTDYQHQREHALQKLVRENDL
ncbi:hypothetical protein GCK72_022874 [Caenorhabditis remanei]|uniref:Protein kinase domain-containing protein n=1 Tax=Caenorhabditis remanei TaxID=31234 RepID=A0A6A5FVD2_CAERE|nr:hypothetical protein GCK72_022874 [Caenorhabditis remanei]KAF1746419.1 hypothetical protein GCK72_022874 [Caenorhabditis remanei]